MIQKINENVIMIESKADYKRAEKAAYDILNEYNIIEPVINAFEIAQRKGFSVKFFKPEGKLNDASGFFDPSTKSIYVNSGDPPNRQSFTVAHELAHALLGHRENEYGVLWRLATPIDKKPVEQEANWFAANLLVPEKFLDEAMKKYNLNENDLDFISKIFGVSKDVIKYRTLWMKKPNS